MFQLIDLDVDFTQIYKMLHHSLRSCLYVISNTLATFEAQLIQRARPRVSWKKALLIEKKVFDNNTSGHHMLCQIIWYQSIPLCVGQKWLNLNYPSWIWYRWNCNFMQDLLLSGHRLGAVGEIFYGAFFGTTCIEQLTTNFDPASLCVAGVTTTNHNPSDFISLKIKNNENYTALSI